MRGLLDRLQQTLEALYRVDGPARVADFFLPQDHYRALAGQTVLRREALLVSSDGEFADIGLYIQDDVLARASRFVRDVTHDGIDAFCVAVEGVSHFLYLTFCGGRLGRPVSRIEMELQAEVDKYVLLKTLLGANDLIDRLYQQVHIDERLPREEMERYRVANTQARRYARWVERAFVRGQGGVALQDARALYRKTLASKLEHIARAA